MDQILGGHARTARCPRWLVSGWAIAFLAGAVLTVLAPTPARAAAWEVDGPAGGLISSVAAAPSDASRVYASVPFGGVLRSVDGGVSFERVASDPGTTLIYLAVDPADRDLVLAIACDFSVCTRVVRSLDGGRTWQVSIEGGELFAPFSLRFGPRAAFLSTSNGLFRSDDGGATWAASGLQGFYVESLAFDPHRPGVALAATSGPFVGTVGLWRSEDGGRSWQPRRTPRNWFEVRQLRFDPVRPGTVYAVANRRAVRSTDGGATWQVMLFSREVWRLQVLGDGTVLASPSGPRLDRVFGVLRSGDGGQSFSPATDPGNPRTARPADAIGEIVAGASPQRAIALGGLGLWTTADSGRSWQPASRGIASHDVQALSVSQGGTPRVYATTPAGLFARDGVTGRWRKMHNGPLLGGVGLYPGELLGLEVDPSDSLHLVAFHEHGMVDSHDGGRTWRSLGALGLNPRRVVRVAAIAPDWSSGSIYAAALVYPAPGQSESHSQLALTFDEGATWGLLDSFSSEVPTVDSLALAVDPRDPSILWARSTAAGLFRSGDRGRTWQPTGAGLPETSAAWLQTRAALGFDGSDPQRMAVGVPGHGVWESADGGRSFHRSGSGLDSAVVTSLVSAMAPGDGGSRWYAGALGQGVFRLSGGHWTPVGAYADPSQFSGPFAFDPADPAVLYAGTFSNSVLRLDLEER